MHHPEPQPPSFRLFAKTNSGNTRQGTNRFMPHLSQTPSPSQAPPAIDMQCHEKSLFQAPSTSQTPPPNRQGIERYMVPHQCPTCLGYFSRADIEIHADLCAESWVDPIGDCGETDGDQENLDDTLTADEISDLHVFPEPIECRREVIQKLMGNVKRTSINRIAIRRREAFADYADARRKKWFTEEGSLKINFVGEPSVDGGGPRREFFTDVLHHIKFTLFNSNGYPLVNTRALANEEFKIAGELMASSLAQEGPAPCLLAPNVFDYVAKGICSIQSHNWLEHVEDENFKKEIEKLKNCTSDDELRTLLFSDETMEVLQSIGYRSVPSKETLASRGDIIRSIVIAGMSHILAMMDQLTSGLMLFGVLEQIRHHKDVMASMLTLEGATNFHLTADIMLDNLTVEFSPEGSNKKTQEINIHKFFCDYIQEMGTREDADKALPNLYKFITGSRTVTPLGAEKHIAVKFKHGCAEHCKCRPTAATCDPSISFPMHYSDSKDFELAVDNALQEYFGFGLV